MEYSDIHDGMVLSDILERDPAYFKQHMRKTQDGRIITAIPMQIVFPEDYIRKSLCTMNETLSCLGIFALVDIHVGKYAVFSIPNRVSITIVEMMDLTYRDEVYKVLHFDKFDTLFVNDHVIMDDKIQYWIYDYFVALAKVPWYLSYRDILTIYDRDERYVGKWLGGSSQVVEMILGNIARDPDNNKQMFRQVVKTVAQMDKMSPSWIPLRNVSLGSVDTLSKIMGSYYDDGLASALAEDSKTLTKVEEVLRA